MTETNVLYLRWLFSRHATDANVKVLLNEHENSNKDLAMDLNLCIHLQPLKLTLNLVFIYKPLKRNFSPQKAARGGFFTFLMSDFFMIINHNGLA